MFGIMHLAGEAGPLVRIVYLGKLATAAVSRDTPLTENVHLVKGLTRSDLMENLDHLAVVTAEHLPSVAAPPAEHVAPLIVLLPVSFLVEMLTVPAQFVFLILYCCLYYTCTKGPPVQDGAGCC
jgi:hypothetical protein